MDRIDGLILEELQKNARLSNKELAVRVNLAPSSCLERVRRLTETGVLRGVHASVDPASLGIELQAFIAVRLVRHSRRMVERFRAHVSGLPELVALYHVAGEMDFLAHVAIRNSDHLRDLAMDAFTTRDEVAEIRTSLIFEHVPHWQLPNYRVTQGEATRRTERLPGPRPKRSRIARSHVD